MPRSKTFVLVLATLSATAFGGTANQARPGTLNYIEGQASTEGRQLSSKSVGSTELGAGQYLSTANGKAEILLTPGVFLRLGNDSSVQMVSPNLTKTEVRIDRGRAEVEVDQLYKQNTILVDMKDSQIHLVKNGLYSFDTENGALRVFDGKADVFPAQNLNAYIKPIEVKGSRELVLTGEPTTPQHFDKNHTEDDLYKWSSLRSQYLGEANVNLASAYAGYPGFYPGWYWAGGPYGYTWLPGNGLFWSPFGYGFYSPYYVYGGGFIYGRYGRGAFAYRGDSAFRGGAFVGGAARPAAVGGGFRGGGGRR